MGDSQYRIAVVQPHTYLRAWGKIFPFTFDESAPPEAKTLEEAANRSRNERVNPRDPETGEPYRYTVKNETTYELCATFARPRDWDSRVFWNHRAGAHCFTINVLDPPPF